MPPPQEYGRQDRVEQLGVEREKGSPKRTGLILRAATLSELEDPRALPISGLRVSALDIGQIFGGKLRVTRIEDPFERTSPDGVRRERIHKSYLSGGTRGGETVAVSYRSLTQNEPNKGQTEFHSSARFGTNYDAYWVPPSESALLTYPTTFEVVGRGGGIISYGDLVEQEVSGAAIVLPGNLPHAISPAVGYTLDFMHATNDFQSQFGVPRQVQHVEVLNLPSVGEPDPNAFWLLGHTLGVGGKEIGDGAKGDETVVVRQYPPVVTLAEVVDTTTFDFNNLSEWLATQKGMVFGAH